jgi:hypothetical protein
VRVPFYRYMGMKKKNRTREKRRKKMEETKGKK